MSHRNNKNSSSNANTATAANAPLFGNLQTPAAQRLLVVGNCMSGKRALVDRLRRAAEPPMSSSSGGGSSGGANKAHHRYRALAAGASGGGTGSGDTAANPTASAAAGAAAEGAGEGGLLLGADAVKSLAAGVRGCALQYAAFSHTYNHVDIRRMLDAALDAQQPSATAANTNAAGDGEAEKNEQSMANHEDEDEENAAGVGEDGDFNTTTDIYASPVRSRKALSAAIQAVGGTPLHASQQSSSSGHHSSNAAQQHRSSPQQHHPHGSDDTSAAGHQRIEHANCLLEIFICDTPDALAAALPTLATLAVTAVIIVLDAVDTSHSSYTVQRWVTAINNRVRALEMQTKNTTTTSSSAGHHASSSAATTNSTTGATGAGAGAGLSAAGGAQAKHNAESEWQSKLAQINVGSYLEARNIEDACAAQVFRVNGITDEVRRGEDNNDDGGLSGASTIGGGGGGKAPVMPDRLRLLLPGLVVLNKTDILEELCRASGGANDSNNSGSTNTTSASGGSSGAAPALSGGIKNFGIAFHNARWEALQRGAGFAATSCTAHSNSTNLFFDGLWTYILYGLLPGHLAILEHLEAQWRAAVAARRSRAGAQKTADEEADEARREIEALDAKQKRQRKRVAAAAAALASTASAGSFEATSGNESTVFDMDSLMQQLQAEGAGNAEDAEDRGLVERVLRQVLLTAVALDPAVRPAMNIHPCQLTLLPRGVDSASLLPPETTLASLVSKLFRPCATSQLLHAEAVAAAAAAAATAASNSKSGGGGASSSPTTTSAQTVVSAADATSKMHAQFEALLRTDVQTGSAKDAQQAAQQAAAAFIDQHQVGMSAAGVAGHQAAGGGGAPSASAAAASGRGDEETAEDPWNF